MLSSVTVVDNHGNLRHLPQSSCVTNSANSMKNVIALNNSTPWHISESANTDQNGTNVPASVYQTQQHQRRMSQYADFKDATYTCAHCQAKYWHGERTVRRSSITNPRFSTCCSEGKVVLPLLFHPPPLLIELMDYSGGERSKLFWKKLKLLNSMFFFTSTGGNINREINDGSGPYAFQINGHNHHRIGTLLPTHADGRPRFAQLYIYDTEHEVDNRLYALNITSPSGAVDNNLCSLVQDLITMLDMHNPLVQSFRMAKDRFVQSSIQPVTLHLIGTRQSTRRQYNLPTALEVTALILGDGNPKESHDVIFEERSNEENRNGVKRISELHLSFMALQYPLLFPYGEDVFHLHIPLNVPPTTKIQYLSLREYYCFRLQIQVNEGRTLHKAGRLFHSFCVDAYTAVLDHDLDRYKRNQHTIRSEHMIQQYQDAMAICRWAGPLDLFVTMTCNPKWPEIQREVENRIPGQPTVDRLDTIARVFKMKLNDLIEDIRKGNHFGRVKAVIYTIEFQKHGLPHCHSLIFLHEHDKISSTDEINHVISVKLPSEIDDPIAFNAVHSHMMHGPCGELYKLASCMSRDTYVKAFLKQYCEDTFITRDGWPHYRRPNNGRKVQVGRQNIMLDNRFVVPHNIDLIVKYDYHINVEWCNQGTLVKYLFSYLNKGLDRATVVIEGQRNKTNNSTTTTNINNTTYSFRMTTNSNITPTTTTTNTNNNTRMSYAAILPHQDEIKQYLSCRYISASESCWHLLGYEIHYRSVTIERLTFHEKAMSKFTEWMKANEMYPEIGSNLTVSDHNSFFKDVYQYISEDFVRKQRRNRLIAAERMYNANEEWSRFTSLYGGLNPQQRDVYDNIMQVINEINGVLFFVYGCGGTGKTYLWKTIISWIRSLGRIVLSVASSGIASLLLPGGRTTHSRFRIPMELDNKSRCGIDVVSDLADLIRAVNLIIWDEAPLQHRHDFEAVDLTFRDIFRLDNPNANNQVFDGKVVVLGGDFRQILPVILNASRVVVVSSAVNKSSSAWDYCKVFVWSINMRLCDPTLDVTNTGEIMRFHNWLIARGDGRLPCIALDGEDDATWITIPEDLLIPVDDNPVEAIVSSTFLDLLNRIQDINYLKERCIMSPTNNVVDKINSHVLASMSGEMHKLLSADTICSTTDNLEDMQIMYPPEFLNTLRFSGVLNHKLELKIANLKAITSFRIIKNCSDIELNVSLWGKCDLAYDDNVIASKKDTNIVVVLTCCKVGFYAGGPELKSTASSQIYLNLPIAETISYSQRYKLVITVQDDNEEIECVLFNSEATPLLGITIEELFYKTITVFRISRNRVYSDLSISSPDSYWDTNDYAIHDENLGSTISEYEEKLMDGLEWGQDVFILKPAANHICMNEVPHAPDTSTNDFSVNDPNKGKSIVDVEPVGETHLNNFTHDESLSLPELASDVNKDVSPLSSPIIEPDEMPTRGDEDKMTISVDEAAINQHVDIMQDD
uniref:ATP-dependent DNA helicase n=1 Tax=Tanacetum cinerariifolium TaxID=118510 RepID=A0A6L2JH38_TANCI|nr:uncharacterized protein [Tanacetum cinerariifolium]